MDGDEVLAIANALAVVNEETGQAPLGRLLRAADGGSAARAGLDAMLARGRTLITAFERAFGQ